MLITKSLDIRIFVVGSRVQTLARRSAITMAQFLKNDLDFKTFMSPDRNQTLKNQTEELDFEKNMTQIE